MAKRFPAGGCCFAQVFASHKYVNKLPGGALKRCFPAHVGLFSRQRYFELLFHLQFLQTGDNEILVVRQELHGRAILVGMSTTLKVNFQNAI